MVQPGFSSQEEIENGTGAIKSASASDATSTSEDSYLAEIRAYRDQIEEVSKLVNSLPKWELAKKYDTVKEIENQISDAIANLRSLKGNPPVEGFNKSAVIDYLDNASVKLNQAARFATSSKIQEQNMCFDLLKDCRKCLEQASDLISSTFHLY